MDDHFLSKAKILSCFHEIRQIADGAFPAPRTVEVFPSHQCNLSCPYCQSGSPSKAQPVFLDPSLLEGLLEDPVSGQASGVEFSGGGEPLLHPEIGPLLTLPARKGLAVGLITNGLLLDSLLSREVLGGLRFLRISCSGFDPGTYLMFHGVDGWQQFSKALDELVRYRSRHRSLSFSLGIKTLICRDNVKSIEEYIHFARRQKVDYLQFKRRRGGEGELNGDELTRAERNLRTLAERYSTSGFRVLGTFLPPLGGNGKCLLHPLHPVVDADGSVYLCPFFQRRRDQHRIGSLLESPFSTLWGSEDHRKCSSRIDLNLCSEYDCPLEYFNALAEEAIIEGGMHLEFI